jgi:hypothetical protein
LDLVSLLFAIVHIFLIVAVVVCVITGLEGGKYGDGIVLVMKCIFVIQDQMVVQELHRVVLQEIGDHIVVLVNFKKREQKGVLMRILVGLTNVVRLVHLMQAVDCVIQELRR